MGAVIVCLVKTHKWGEREDVLGIVEKMYMMNLEEDDSIDDKMNTTNGENENNSKGDNENIDFTYRGVSSNEQDEEQHNVILETPMTKEAMNRSGTDRLYRLEEPDTKRSKEDKKSKKKKDKKDKKSKKNKNKKNSDEDEIIVASEDVTGSGNDFPTLPVSKQFNNAD